jgi:hypothetical protein
MTRIGIAGLLFLAWFAPSRAPAEGPSDRLVCKGGPSLHRTTIANFAPVEVTTPTGRVTVAAIQSVSYTVRFQRGKKPAGREGADLSPGECAFEDRPVAETEPDSFMDANTAYFSLKVVHLPPQGDHPARIETELEPGKYLAPLLGQVFRVPVQLAAGLWKVKPGAVPAYTK